VIPIAGDQITNDIAMALRTPTAEAEEIKIRYGVAKQVLADPRDAGSAGPGRPSAQPVAPGAGRRDRAARGRAVRDGAQVVRESGYEGVLSSGIVLTGGSIMPGMVEMAEDIFLKPARLGTPEYRGQLADVVRAPALRDLGLLLEAKKQYLRGHRHAAGWIG
jgi:cell division protein FtsA